MTVNISNESLCKLIQTSEVQKLHIQDITCQIADGRKKKEHSMSSRNGIHTIKHSMKFKFNFRALESRILREHSLDIIKCLE